MNSKQLKAMSSFDWGDIYKQLTAMSIYWTKIFFGKNWNNLPKGFTHEDIAQEAIRRATDRDWSEFSNEILMTYLFGSIKSIVSNLRRSVNRQKTSTFTGSSSFEDRPQDIGDGGSPESLFFDIDYKFIVSSIEKKIAKDAILLKTFNEIRKGKSPREIAKSLEIEVEEVYNLKKRLFRVVDEVACLIK